MTDAPRKESVVIQQELARGSKVAAYRDLVIGRPGWRALVRYELVMLLSQNVPGALGLWLRSKLYPCLLGACGRGVVFGKDVVLRHPHKIRVADGAVFDDHVVLDAKGRDNAGIEVGEGTFVGRNSILSCKNGDLTLGRRVNIGFHCEVFSGSRVTLGDDAMLAAYTYVVGGGHDFDDPDRPASVQGRSSRGVEIGAGVWLGAGAKVLDGVTVGAGTIGGAGAVVTKNLPADVIAAGVPAKVVRERAPASEKEMGRGEGGP